MFAVLLLLSRQPNQKRCHTNRDFVFEYRLCGDGISYIHRYAIVSPPPPPTTTISNANSLTLCVCVFCARWRCGCVWRVSLPAPVITTTTKTVVVSDSNFTHHCSWNCKKIQFDFFAFFSCRIPLETIHKANWKRNRTIVLYCWFDAILFHTCRMENFLVLLLVLVLVLLLLFRAFEFC